MFRRSRFAEVVARQLDVFAADEAQGLLEEVREAKTVYDGAGRDEAEERYADAETRLRNEARVSLEPHTIW